MNMDPLGLKANQNLGQEERNWVAVVDDGQFGSVKCIANFGRASQLRRAELAGRPGQAGEL